LISLTVPASGQSIRFCSGSARLRHGRGWKEQKLQASWVAFFSNCYLADRCDRGGRRRDRDFRARRDCAPGNRRWRILRRGRADGRPLLRAARGSARGRRMHRAGSVESPADACRAVLGHGPGQSRNRRVRGRNRDLPRFASSVGRASRSGMARCPPHRPGHRGGALRVGAMRAVLVASGSRLGRRLVALSSPQLTAIHWT
jgi:hypothetical protein